MQSNDLFDVLSAHVGHEIVSSFVDEGSAILLECVDCDEHVEIIHSPRSIRKPPKLKWHSTSPL